MIWMGVLLVAAIVTMIVLLTVLMLNKTKDSTGMRSNIVLLRPRVLSNIVGVSGSSQNGGTIFNTSKCIS
jgi:hypothetical protein